ncbi:MAG: hypothetical protein B6D46_02240 [Polyangiaceae bacterium UTPRO1]|jgi:tetratricopeptide (TPR) repeat protein|nr:hypothetical protein [Myxococcales bacterium]OQY68940.1 MAG: hypothetical protein B6D46_02240 [Polyangiaceae bacterium UTPRO1]
MKKILDLLIHLEDHKHDGLGRLFLDPGDEREMRRSLREYLGAKVAVKSAVVEGQRMRVRVELPDFQAESDNLVRLARDLAGRARPGAALGQLEEALKIFPLNGAALKGLGRACYGRGDFAGATAFFVRANEVLREDGEALKALGAMAQQEGREPSALAYYERAAAANPKDDAAREALERLRERMARKFRPSEAAAELSEPPPRRSR